MIELLDFREVASVSIGFNEGASSLGLVISESLVSSSGTSFRGLIGTNAAYLIVAYLFFSSGTCLRSSSCFYATSGALVSSTFAGAFTGFSSKTLIEA